MISSGIRLFNAAINPYYLAIQNLALFGISGDQLLFSSTDGYRRSMISNGVNMYQDIAVADKLFYPANGVFELAQYEDLPDISKANADKADLQGTAV